MDDMTDDAPLDSTDGQQVAAGAVRHLTYGQIGERFGMSADAARQLVRRRGWCRSRPNAIGQPVVVAVPEAELTGEHPRPTVDGKVIGASGGMGVQDAVVAKAGMDAVTH